VVDFIKLGQMAERAEGKYIQILAKKAISSAQGANVQN
jgi:hypothetical protein